MDATAVSLCMDNDLPIVVFELMGEGNVVRAMRGEEVGTLVTRLDGCRRINSSRIVRAEAQARNTARTRSPTVIDDTLLEAEEKMDKAVSVAKDEFASSAPVARTRACSTRSPRSTTAPRPR